MDGCVCVRGWGVIFLKPMKKLCVLATLRMFLMIIMHFDLVGICLLSPPPPQEFCKEQWDKGKIFSCHMIFWG